MSNVFTLERNKYEIKIDNFEGPMDLLLHLIDKNKMDIYDVKISKITDQYIEYINRMEELNLIIASEFTVMASTLIYIKSRKLLPKHEDSNEEEITEEELIRRIIEYKKYKEITKKFKDNYEEFSKRFFGNQEKISLPIQEIEENYDINRLIEIYKNLWKKNEEKKNVNAKNIEKIAIMDTYTVHSKVKEMLKILLHKPKFIFNKVYTLKKCNNQEIVTAFSGMLELSRRNKVITNQQEIFGNIIVEKIKKINE